MASGLVKKGKFVRRMMEIMGDGKTTAKRLFSTGEVGPTLDYVQTNLDKLIESKEINVEGDLYSLPVGYVAPKTTTQAATVEHVDEETGEVTEEVLSKPTTQQTFNSFKTITMYEGEKLPRNKEMETFLGVAYVQDVPDWKQAVTYYCSTHKAKWSIVDHKKNIGERLEFLDA